jgi:hypothetical protein
MLKIMEGTKEFAALKKCGVVNVRHDAQGKELFNIEWLLALYTPTEWFTRKIITTIFTKKKMTNNEHGKGTSTNIVADQHLKEDVHEECSICLDTSEFTEGVKLPCKVGIFYTNFCQYLNLSDDLSVTLFAGIKRYNKVYIGKL